MPFAKSVRARILLATLVLLLLLAGVAALAAWRAQHDKEVDRLLDRRGGVVSALEDARARTFLLATRMAVSIFQEDSTAVLDEFPPVVSIINEDLETARAGLLAMGETDEVATLDGVNGQNDQLLQDPDVVALVQASLTGGNKMEIGQQYYPRIWPKVERMTTDLDELALSESARLEIERDAAVRTANSTLALVIGFSALAFLGAAATLGSLGASVVRPLASLKATARAVTSGKLDSRAKVSGPEEVASLARDFNDMVEERRRAEEALKLQAATDSLTGLLNHRSLYEALAKETESSLASGRPMAVLMMDMDGFKLFNDTYGHQEGDRVLRQVARLLERELRANDILGRYGGDEFMVIMPGTDRNDAVSCANRIIEALSKERVQPRDGHELPLTASIGLALCPDDSRHKEELIAYADASLLEAKQLTGGNLVVAQHGPDDLLVRRRTPFGVLDALVRAVDRKDRYTRHHSQQNAEFAVELGKAIGLSEDAVDALRVSGLLHDVGKIGVPDDILRKPGPLTDEEQGMMQEHVVLSNLIVHGVPNLQDVSDAVYSHHERWDGKGYPRGLKGEEIPLAGRIMALVDAYSAMILDRPYRKALSKEQAVAELRGNAGSQFDPALVEPFIGLLESREKAAA